MESKNCLGLGGASEVLLRHLDFMVTEIDGMGRDISRLNKA
jgi:hypothetical protein